MNNDEFNEKFMIPVAKILDDLIFLFKTRDDYIIKHNPSFFNELIKKIEKIQHIPDGVSPTLWSIIIDAVRCIKSLSLNYNVLKEQIEKLKEQNNEQRTF